MLVLFISLYKQRNVILGYTKKMIIIRNNCKIDHRHKYLKNDKISQNHFTPYLG